MPDWCGKRAPKGYESFRTALADFRAASYEADSTITGVIADLTGTCDPRPANPQEVELIVERLSFSGRPAIERANAAWNRMKAAQKEAFAGDPLAPAVGVDIDALNAVIESYGRSIMLLESAGELFAACNSDETYAAASAALEPISELVAKTGQDSIQVTGDIQMAFQATQDTCKAVRVREEIPDKQIKKVGAPTTKKSSGAALTYPRTLDVGNRAVKLPLNVKSPNAGYGTVTVKRGPKGIVATGGWMDPGTFGLLMTVPGKTKPGKVTVTLELDGGPTVKGTITLR